MTTSSAGDEERLVARATYMVGNPSAWDDYDEGASAVIRDLLADNARLRQERDEARAEVDRCHERLEIDHYWKIGENDDSDLERVEVPVAERGGMPDGISARDATIALMQEDLSASNAEAERLREALRPFAEFAERIIRDHPGWDHDTFVFSGAFAPFRRAARALQGSAKQ